MNTVAERLSIVQGRIADAAFSAGRDPSEITLVAATKTQTSDTIREAVAAGITVCGENRVQELNAHLSDHAYDGCQVHFIGHLQTNKVKYVVGKTELIHSVSSEKLIQAIDGQADKLGIVQDILLEVNLANELSKSGFSEDELLHAAILAYECSHVRLRGLMCIPPPANSPEENRPFFSRLRSLAVDISRKIGDNTLDIADLSMGMSSDYQDAVAEGATFVRLGSALFGPRTPVSPKT